MRIVKTSKVKTYQTVLNVKHDHTQYQRVRPDGERFTPSNVADQIMTFETTRPVYYGIGLSSCKKEPITSH